MNTDTIKTLTEDCERCEGTGRVEASDYSGDTFRCPDCCDGKVPVTCDALGCEEEAVYRCTDGHALCEACAAAPTKRSHELPRAS